MVEKINSFIQEHQGYSALGFLVFLLGTFVALDARGKAKLKRITEETDEKIKKIKGGL